MIAVVFCSYSREAKEIARLQNRLALSKQLASTPTSISHIVALFDFQQQYDDL